MNTAKIATLYPYYLDALRQLHTGRSLDDMLTTVQQALRLKASAATSTPNRWVALRDHEHPVHRFDHLGLLSEDHLKELVPARLFDWVCRQQPAQPTYSTDLAGMLARHEASLQPVTGWQVTAHEVAPALTGVPGRLVSVPSTQPERRYATWTGSEQELAGLLRGLRAFRAKRRKHTRKLLAQLWAYHLQQQAAPRPEELSLLAVSAVGISCANTATPDVAEATPPAARGLLPRLVGRLRRGLAAKIHQIAVAAEAALAAEGGIAA